MKNLFLFVLISLLVSTSVMAASADIEITSLRMEPEVPRVGDFVRFNYSITNLGPDAANVSVSTEINGPRGGIGNSWCCELMTPGQHISFVSSHQIIYPGYYTFNVSAWPMGGVTDPIEWNNRRALLFQALAVGGTSSPSFMKIKPAQVFESPENTNWVILVVGLITLVLVFLMYRTLNKQSKQRRR